MNRCLISIALLILIEQSAIARQKILINQLGYRPRDSKVALVKQFINEKFEVINSATNKVVYTGKVRAIGIHDESTGDLVFQMDFSGVKIPGTYRLRIRASNLLSDEFTIATTVYDTAALFSLQSFYYQRCGIEIANKTPWRHPLCHSADAVFYDNPSTHKDVTGGWHDAGDYGKFVPTAAVSAAFLLYLYEYQPAKFSDNQLQIPESHNGIPDILDEARWELEWLLKMQRDDGGVHHKVSTKKWTGEYLPDRDPDQRYIFGVSSVASAGFAAVTALGSRLFNKWDKPFADRLLRASQRAWQFLEAHPFIVPTGGFRNPSDVEGGEYGDTQDDDERLWASAELYRTTSNEMYHRFFLTKYQSLGGLTYPLSWQRVQNFAYYSYLRGGRGMVDNKARAFIMYTLTAYCDNLLRRIESNGYRFVLRSGEYYWGSNSVALGYAFDLLQAYEVTKTQRYLDGALDQLHYILGRNLFDQTFITAIGINPVRHPYHQFSMMLNAGSPVPGLVVGGPNKNSRLREKILSEWPGKCYEDNEKNYFVNEVAINYTAPFVFVAGYCSVFGKPAAGSTSIGSR